MPSVTKDSPRTNQPLSLLLQGPPGGGKSTLAMQFPSPFFLDCDMNLAGPERYLRRTNSFPGYSYETIKIDDKGELVPTKDRWARLVTFTEKAIKDPSTKTIVPDSLTSIDEILVAHVLDKTKALLMERQDWRLFRSLLLSYFDVLRSSNKTVIVTVHEDVFRDSKGIIERYAPTVSSGITHYLGAYFTDVWRCESLPGPLGKQKFIIKCLRSAQLDLKNSLNMPEKIEDVTYDKLKQYLT